MDKLSDFLQTRWAWGILALSGVFLELCALNFQYIMELPPCVMCVYVRVAVIGIILAGIIGAIGVKFYWVRLFAGLITIISVVWAFKLNFVLNDMQLNPEDYQSCSFMPEWPVWFELHYWMPSMFMPTGACTDDVWSMMGLSMAQWLLVTFGIYMLVLAVLIKPLVKPSK